MKYLKLFENSSMIEKHIENIVDSVLKEYNDCVSYWLDNYEIEDVDDAIFFDLYVEENIHENAITIIDKHTLPILKTNVYIDRNKLQLLIHNITEELDNSFEKVNVTYTEYEYGISWSYQCTLNKNIKRSINTGLWDLKKEGFLFESNQVIDYAESKLKPYSLELSEYDSYEDNEYEILYIGEYTGDVKSGIIGEYINERWVGRFFIDIIKGKISIELYHKDRFISVPALDIYEISKKGLDKAIDIMIDYFKHPEDYKHYFRGKKSGL